MFTFIISASLLHVPQFWSWWQFTTVIIICYALTWILDLIMVPANKRI